MFIFSSKEAWGGDVSIKHGAEEKKVKSKLPKAPRRKLNVTTTTSRIARTCPGCC
jgi:hypothetical protein